MGWLIGGPMMFSDDVGETPAGGGLMCAVGCEFDDESGGEATIGGKGCNCPAQGPAAAAGAGYDAGCTTLGRAMPRTQIELSLAAGVAGLTAPFAPAGSEAALAGATGSGAAGLAPP